MTSATAPSLDQALAAETNQGLDRAAQAAALAAGKDDGGRKDV